jgi:hypothetical protein
MVKSIPKFQNLVAQIEKSRKLQDRMAQAIKWYKDCIEKHSRKKARKQKNTKKEPKKPDSKAPENEPESPIEQPDETTFRIGQIYSFSYDPKYADTLEYYDVFPLSLIVGFTSNGFVGLNFHYLSPMDRAAFLDLLQQFIGLDEETQKLQINITQAILSSRSNLSYYKPCFKKYLYGRVKSEPIMIRPHEWDITLFLPTEQFVKASKEEVWSDSKLKMK